MGNKSSNNKNTTNTISGPPYHCLECKYLWDSKDAFIMHKIKCLLTNGRANFSDVTERFDGVNIPNGRCPIDLKGKYCLKLLPCKHHDIRL